MSSLRRIFVLVGLAAIAIFLVGPQEMAALLDALLHHVVAALREAWNVGLGGASRIGW